MTSPETPKIVSPENMGSLYSQTGNEVFRLRALAKNADCKSVDYLMNGTSEVEVTTANIPASAFKDDQQRNKTTLKIKIHETPMFQFDIYDHLLLLPFIGIIKPNNNSWLFLHRDPIDHETWTKGDSTLGSTNVEQFLLSAREIAEKIKKDYL